MESLEIFVIWGVLVERNLELLIRASLLTFLHFQPPSGGDIEPISAFFLRWSGVYSITEADVFAIIDTSAENKQQDKASECVEWVVKGFGRPNERTTSLRKFEQSSWKTTVRKTSESVLVRSTRSEEGIGNCKCSATLLMVHGKESAEVNWRK